MKIKFPAAALLILSLAGLSLVPANAATDTSQKGITVSATGTVKVTPDTVRLSTTISALAATNKEALAKANESASTFRTVLLAAKIDKKDAGYIKDIEKATNPKDKKMKESQIWEMSYLKSFDDLEFI